MKRFFYCKCLDRKCLAAPYDISFEASPAKVLVFLK